MPAPFDKIVLAPARFAAGVARGFKAHRGLVRAASLSYTTLLALVPLVALVLSISKGVLRNQDPEFLQRTIDRALSYAVPQLDSLPAEDAASARGEVLARIREPIDRIHAGALGVFGALTLVTVGITLLSAIEAALNDIFGVPRGRTLAHRIAYYWAGVTLGPLLVFFSIGLTSSGVVATLLGFLPTGAASAAFRFFLPFLALTIGFTLLYWAMPNTPVPLRAALWGGLCAGTLFQLNNLMSAVYFSQVLSYSRVYGSLGAIPVLMVGLYLAWAIVLVGAEVARAAASGRRDAPRYPESFDERSRIVLEVARITASEFIAGRGGSAPADIAEALDVPLDWVERALATLSGAGIVIAAARSNEGRNGGAGYLPARPPRAIAALEIVDAVRRSAAENEPAAPRSPAVSDLFSKLRSSERAALGDVTLEDLAAPPPRGGSE